MAVYSIFDLVMFSVIFEKLWCGLLLTDFYGNLLVIAKRACLQVIVNRKALWFIDLFISFVYKFYTVLLLANLF